MPLRKCVYNAVACNVPVEQVGPVILYTVKEMTGQSITSMPDVSTVGQMVYEMGIISDLQAGTVLLSGTNHNLAFDATGIDGSHINEVHVNTDSHGSVVLQIPQLAGGQSTDYVEHMTDALSDIAHTYATFHNTEPDSTLSSIHGKISSTLSDRCAVNHCVVQALEQHMQLGSIVELNCNVHPLDGMASSARSALKKIDVETQLKSGVFGSDCTLANFVYGMTKMRYKQGRGDPAGFKKFMVVENIPKKLVCRYVGNRFHVLFHLSAVFHAYSSQFTTYLKKFCNNTTGLRTSLLADIQNKAIQIQLEAMGLFGKLLTGPWMVIFYKNEEKLSNVSMQPFMKKAIAWLEQKVETPQGLLTTIDAFGRNITGDHMLETLCGPVQSEQDEFFSDVVRKLSAAFLTVLQRQLKRYLDGDLSQLPQDVINKAASAQSHNMYADGVLGMTDAQKRRAPNASDGFIDAKVKFQKNNTMKWLNDKTEKSYENCAVRHDKSKTNSGNPG